ncbi:unnamed protein product [Arabis nemorensis]|uniref:tRNA synthetases class I (E and Q) anti-codon binding domain-containing protein n=1 Tax=Arabis nemorensis TaxID=586526 RepID=A0A565BMD0_9BRAS|nr:unnamed protein product [Arabis nemorensis]
MDWGNANVETITKDQGTVTAITGNLHLEGSVKTTKLKLTWLPDSCELVNLTLIEFGDLFKEGFDYPPFGVNECTRKEVLAFGDSNMKHLKRGDVVQLQRKGYFICDVPYDTVLRCFID